ncbi:hypothetical protein [Streptomyces erythrochromogenes]|uniref:hypothetical protein n=1 Tax=Streptomyces erythrochromogenes TaxID=285574 RepID=UPI00224FEB2F|nr:hypothetical protein [Streptomyces erythrochromogenes]MCX5586037.1 hypothetical protein [Streptomyces erythrochromogenes]
MRPGPSRVLAEHEAAHAVVARHFGFDVVSIVIGEQRGFTEWRNVGAELWQQAAITAAGDLFNRECGSVPYINYGCGDLKRFEEEHGLARLWDANRAARSILTQRRRAILTLADRIQRERYIRFDQAAA